MEYKHQNQEVPAKTAELAQKVFKRGNIYVQMRDDLGVIFENEMFRSLFSHVGRPAEAPGNLALILVMQYMEKLSDRQAAEQVGARIDWKYILGLKLEDEGIRYQILTDFRKRIVEGDKVEFLLNTILEQLEEKGWLPGKKKQRTDATYILSAARQLTRLELAWEALSGMIEELAWRAPKWLEQQIDVRWVEAYARPMGWHRLPEKKAEREKVAVQIGKDGHELWQRIVESPFYEEWRTLAEVEGWRQIWIQQYCIIDGVLQWRQKGNLPPASIAIATPHDVTARYGEQQRGTGHVGYQVHYTETIATRQQPQVITEVSTTPSPVPDVKMTPIIQQKLADKKLPPKTHLVDSGYVSAANMVQSQEKHQIELYGPARQDTSWQKRLEGGFDLSQFQIDWEKKKVTCPQNNESTLWRTASSQQGLAVIRVRFSTHDCRSCSKCEVCTRGKARNLTLRPQKEHEALKGARQRQKTDEFKEVYRARAGVEALMSEATNGLDSRRSRYFGLAKTHLHNVLTAVAINLGRVAYWRLGRRRSRTRRSPLLTFQFA